MSGKRGPITYKGRGLGIIALTVAQMLIGSIHLLIGLTLLAAEILNSQVSIAYDVYTVACGSLVLVFTMYVWQGKKVGWIGTYMVLLFVIASDTLTVLGLPSIPGIPSFAAPTEIGYSIIVIVYLSLPHVRRKFLV
ncbi:MAG: hypothetical protein ABSF44_13790 [Candidatus Bathyarchaeia archaeon]